MSLVTGAQLYGQTPLDVVRHHHACVLSANACASTIRDALRLPELLVHVAHRFHGPHALHIARDTIMRMLECNDLMAPHDLCVDKSDMNLMLPAFHIPSAVVSDMLQSLPRRLRSPTGTIRGLLSLPGSIFECLPQGILFDIIDMACATRVQAVHVALNALGSEVARMCRSKLREVLQVVVTTTSTFEVMHLHNLCGHKRRLEQSLASLTRIASRHDVQLAATLPRLNTLFVCDGRTWRVLAQVLR